MKQIPIKICTVYATDFPSMVFRQLGKREMDFPKKDCWSIEKVKLSQQDWSSYETSWDFNKHPLI